MSWQLTEGEKDTLNTILRAFLNMGGVAESKAVIFTDRPEEWKTDRSPVIVTGDQLPSIPPHQSHTNVHIIQKMAQYLSKAAAEERDYFSFRVVGHTFEEALSRKVHFLFTAVDDDKLVNVADLRVRYLKRFPKEDLDQTASDSSLASESVPEDSIPMCLVMFKDALGADFIECIPPIDEHEPSADHLRAIESRFSPELKDNLNRKLQRFRNRSAEEEHDSFIFTDNAEWWRDARSHVIIDTEPFPPIPSDYDHESFNIARDMRDYFHGLAKRLECAPVYASCLRIGRENRTVVHWLLSMYRERALHHLRCFKLHGLDSPSSEVVSAPAQYMRRAQRRSSSSSADPTFEIDSAIKRRKMTVDSCDTMHSIEDLPESELVPVEVHAIQSRISPEVKENLDSKIKFFAQRAEDVTNAAVIFTNMEGIWVNAFPNMLVVADQLLPPFPSTYDHEKGDLVQDMVDYLAVNVRRITHNQCTVSSLQFGDKDYNKIHLFLTQSEQCAIQHLNCSRPDYERYVPPKTDSTIAIMLSAVYHSGLGPTKPYKTDVMVKQKMRSCPVHGHDDPARPAEDKPSPGPSIGSDDAFL